MINLMLLSTMVGSSILSTILNKQHSGVCADAAIILKIISCIAFINLFINLAGH